MPLYALKSPSAPYFWITPEQRTTGEALQVITAHDNGDLSLSDGTRISASDPDFQRGGDFQPPSVYIRIPDGDRADIVAKAVYGSGFWTVEIKRALTTGSNVDVQFDDLSKDHPFGVAVFDNAAIAHATSSESVFLRFK